MILTRAATAIAYGFLATSAIANFLFAFTLAKSPAMSIVYGSVGVLATAANAVIPLRMLAAWETRRYPVLVAGAILLPLCIAFSLTSAMGFAASARDGTTAARAALAQNYATTLTTLTELEAKPRTTKTEQRIDALRSEIKSYRERGALQLADPQASALEIIGISDSRYVISLLFALLIEAGSALGLLIALVDLKRKEAVPQWKPKAG